MSLPVYSTQYLATEERLGCVVGAVVNVLSTGREGKKCPEQGQKQPSTEDRQEQPPDDTAQFPGAHHDV